MKFEHQISITSLTGAGSSSLVSALGKRLHDQPYRWISGGGLMRERASQLGMSIDEFARYNRKHPEEGHDQWCDESIARMAQSDWMICESRLSHYFMPKAFKVVLECSLGTRARRRQKDQPDRSVADVMQKINERDKNDRMRYELLYPGCMWDVKQFDLLLSSESASPDQLAGYLIEEHDKWVRALSRQAVTTG